jgi:hypothetical protein
MSKVTGELSDDPVAGANRIIAPFALLDFAVVIYRKQNTDSLAAFMDIVVEPYLEAETQVQQTKMIVFKEKYEKFCFETELKESDMRENKFSLEKRGLGMMTLQDSSTEVFKNIRLKTLNELEEEVR